MYLEEGVGSGGPLLEVLSQDVGQVSQVLQQDDGASEKKNKSKSKCLFINLIHMALQKPRRKTRVFKIDCKIYTLSSVS